MKTKLWRAALASIILLLMAVACGLLALHQYRREEYLWSSLLALGSWGSKFLIPFAIGVILGQPIKRLGRTAWVIAKRIFWRTCSRRKETPPP